MAERTGIEWTDATWNPVRGCSRVSEGCRHCYAETVAARFSDEGAPFHGFADRARTGSKWTGRVEVIWEKLDDIIGWRKPRRIFVNSMSDLFHEALPDDEIAEIYSVMVAAVHLRGHTLQVLTKRSGRMAQLLNSAEFWHQVNSEAGMLVMTGTDPLNRRSDDARATLREYGPGQPPPGIWLGVSVEDQAAADERAEHLRATPAAIRFLSCEPLLAPTRPDLANIDWVICGGERGARPMHPDWARSLRNQCATEGVPFFFKQHGSWITFYDRDKDDPDWRRPPRCDRPGERYVNLAGGHGFHGERVLAMRRVSKRTAGDVLDGRQHHEFPA